MRARQMRRTDRRQKQTWIWNCEWTTTGWLVCRILCRKVVNATSSEIFLVTLLYSYLLATLRLCMNVTRLINRRPQTKITVPRRCSERNTVQRTRFPGRHGPYVIMTSPSDRRRCPAQSLMVHSYSDVAGRLNATFSGLVTSPTPGKGANYCDERVCMSVCPLAYLTTEMFVLTVAVARYSSVDNTICYYVIPAKLWITVHSWAWLRRRVVKVTHKGAAPGAKSWCLRLPRYRLVSTGVKFFIKDGTGVHCIIRTVPRTVLDNFRTIVGGKLQRNFRSCSRELNPISDLTTYATKIPATSMLVW